MAPRSDRSIGIGTVASAWPNALVVAWITAVGAPRSTSYQWFVDGVLQGTYDFADNSAALSAGPRVTFGSGLGDGATHQYNDLPVVVAGWGQKGGHLAVPDGTPLANLWLGQARAFGLQMERFADSSKELMAGHG